MTTFSILNIIRRTVLFSKLGSTERYLHEMLHKTANERCIVVSILHTVNQQICLQRSEYISSYFACIQDRYLFNISEQKA